jgi:hypothetical protein
MLARPTAVFCLLSAAILTARAGSPEPARLYLFLRGGVPPALEFSALKNELASLMREAKISVDWEDTAKPRIVDGSLVVVDLQGDCTVRSRAEVRQGPDSAPLGSTAIANGHILPFTSVDCVALSGVLTPQITAQPAELRSWLYGRAMARVLAHELYHYFGQAREHLDSGVARGKFSASELLQERFEFDGLALARLRNRQSVNNELTNTGHFPNMSTIGQ